VNSLLERIKKKDKEAITLLYNTYGKKLYGFAVGKWNVNEDEAWDLVYKTLYKIISVIDRYTFENESKFNGFVYTSFINNLRNHYQASKKIPQLVELEEKHGSVSEEKENVPKEMSAHMKCLKMVLAQFEDWKRILMLMKAQNFSYEEIATYVQKPADQLKVYYMRAKQVLVEKVNDCVSKSVQ
jgi:DNA-directed RNA polymerase specialized sigma24 family protein